MPWKVLSKDDFINCMVGRIYGCPPDVIKIKSKKIKVEQTVFRDGEIETEKNELIFIQKEQDSFKQTYEEFSQLQLSNQNKLKEISRKMKRVIMKFQNFLNLK
jgi:hypothetical protein